ncbi:unnamed protein product [Clonostachys byssicola]|uniref:Uncharacterized protein n=1 Tax=Clonostachys byssicola TaxID=160290 RepID=A0A9N9UMA9_9HYPO|nr:unnamed protein product [Clonostachys byssicola]
MPNTERRGNPDLRGLLSHITSHSGWFPGKLGGFGEFAGKSTSMPLRCLRIENADLISAPRSST